jgi:hypothetical protein
LPISWNYSRKDTLLTLPYLTLPALYLLFTCSLPALYLLFTCSLPALYLLFTCSLHISLKIWQQIYSCYCKRSRNIKSFQSSGLLLPQPPARHYPLGIGAKKSRKIPENTPGENFRQKCDQKKADTPPGNPPQGPSCDFFLHQLTRGECPRWAPTMSTYWGRQHYYMHYTLRSLDRLCGSKLRWTALQTVNTETTAPQLDSKKQHDRVCRVISTRTSQTKPRPGSK